MNSIARRLVTIPATFLLCVVCTALAPLLLMAALPVDLVRRRKLACARLSVWLPFHLACESVGILATAALWIRFFGRFESERAQIAHHRLQALWARVLWAGARRVFAFEVFIEGLDDAEPGRGPSLIFVRHVSLVDTLLPAVFLSSRHDLRLRYVLKRELRWDPCLDIVGGRLPNVFVDRSGDTTGETARVAALASTLGETDGVLIYPEGTRFTAARRARVLARIEAAGDARLLEAARSYRDVLPPRLGGAIALMEARPDADVLFVAHVGLERMTRFTNLLDGSLVGAQVRLKAWRIPTAEIPADRSAREDWLLDQWARVDAWVGFRLGHRESPEPDPSPFDPASLLDRTRFADRA